MSRKPTGYGRGKNPNSHNKRRMFTPERVEWLRQYVATHSPECTRESTTAAFNAEFNTNTTPSTLRTIANRNGIKFVHKCMPGAYANLVEYTKTVHAKSLGYERKKGDTWYIKTSYRGQSESDNKCEFLRDYTPKHRFMWDEYHPNDKVGDKETVVFLNGDRDDFCEDNLYKISNAVKIGLIKNKMFGGTREQMLTAIKYQELNIELRKHDKNWQEKLKKINKNNN
jgi:hypothetical protein